MNKLINYKNAFWVFVGVLLIWQLFQISKMPLQPWDEAMYANRIDYILDSGNWLDQTDGCIEGLYLSTQPPLYFWLSAATCKIIGNNLFGYRIWALLFGIGSIILLFLLMPDSKTGFYAAIIYGSMPYVLVYQRFGQLDTIYPFFILLGLFFWLKYEKNNKIIHLILVGCSLGLALLSKIIVGMFLPMALGLYLLVRIVQGKKKFTRALLEISIILGCGLLLYLPWFAFMFHTYNMDFVNYHFIYHVLGRIASGVEGNTQQLGKIYYVNQLLIMMSVFTLIILLTLKKLWQNKQQLSLLLAFSAIVPFGIFTLSTTKLQTYTLAILPFTAALAALGLEQLKELKKPVYFYPLLILLMFWSVSQTLRNDVQALHITQIVIIAGVVSLTIGLILHFLQPSFVAFCLLIGMFLLIQLKISKPVKLVDHQMEKYAAYYYKNKFDHLINVDTKRTVDDPLITYYFNRMDINNDPKLQKIRPENHPVFRLDHNNRNALVIVNMKHNNKDYKPYLDDIEAKGIIMFEDNMYRVYIW